MIISNLRKMLFMAVHNLISYEKPKSGESVDGFIRALCDITETCDFGKKKCTHERIVTALLDTGLLRELQLKTDSTLSAAVHLAKQHETVKAQLSVQSDAGSTPLAEVKSLKFDRESKVYAPGAPSPHSCYRRWQWSRLWKLCIGSYQFCMPCMVRSTESAINRSICIMP